MIIVLKNYTPKVPPPVGGIHQSNNFPAVFNQRLAFSIFSPENAKIGYIFVFLLNNYNTMSEEAIPSNAKKVLVGLTEDELKDVAKEAGLSSFVGKQLAQWIYAHHCRDFAKMSNLSKAARRELAARCTLGLSEPVSCHESRDGTKKYLYRTNSGHYVETVFIPDGERATVCVSSQVGCKMNCAFCMTGRQGFQASLTAAEILNQIMSLPEYSRLTNIVFMGQGEPLDNLEAVLRATNVLTASWGFAWSPKRITVSTVGLAKGLMRFLDESKCHLAISLHHPLPSERAKLMPAECAMSIADVVSLLRQYAFFRKERTAHTVSKQRRLSFEYIMFEGINDSLAHADALIALLRGLDCRVNLIRFHDIPNTPLRGVKESSMLCFRDYLTRHGLFSTLRASRGQDILAACGLLSTKKQEEAK